MKEEYNMALIKCPECGAEISDEAKSCPQCGKPAKKEKNHHSVLWVKGHKKIVAGMLIILILAIGICALRVSGKKESSIESVVMNVMSVNSVEDMENKFGMDYKKDKESNDFGSDEFGSDTIVYSYYPYPIRSSFATVKFEWDTYKKTIVQRYISLETSDTTTLSEARRIFKNKLIPKAQIDTDTSNEGGTIYTKSDEMYPNDLLALYVTTNNDGTEDGFAIQYDHIG